MGFVDYPVTRDVKSPYFRVLYALFALGYIAVITVINIYAVGYEPTPTNSYDFNNTQHIKLWYERFVPPKIRDSFPETWKCQPSIIKVNNG
jgi:hypothetical protein